jgi:hypothetical protein
MVYPFWRVARAAQEAGKATDLTHRARLTAKKL